ncbi:MAG TPA: methyltransferase domain-containing protein [Acidobacteriaceae bacterium]
MRPIVRLLTTAAAALLSLAPLQTQARAQTPVQTPASSHPTSTPYTGPLNIFDEPGRDQKLQIQHVMDVLNLHPGSIVADIGAGGGWFSVRAARRVAGGPHGSGRVIAEDINPDAISAIRTRAATEHLTNIVPLLGTPDDPRLTPDSLDAALMLRVYHEIAHPPLLLAHLHDALKPHARFGVIDHPGHGDDHGINPSVVIAEVQRNGFHLIHQYDFTKGDQNDYMLVFERR